jgi:hypothetical protein
MIFLLAAISAIVFAWLEWRRPDERNRARRIVAVCVATCALALLGLFRASASASAPNVETEAVLLTQGAPSDVAAAPRLALPRAGLTNKGAIVVPDVAYVRRQYPELRHLRVLGDGLEAFEIAPLEGVRISYEGEATPPSQPAITSLNAPREVTLGAPINVSGRIEGMNAAERVLLSLESPDGTKTEAIAAAGSSAFTISAPAPSAEGRFVWRLRMSRARSDAAELLAEEQIGIAVVKPALPRVLALDGAPRLETAHLQRWFAEMGGSFRSRTLVGADRYRFASTSAGTAEFGAITAELLEDVDVVLLDRRALAALSTEERNAMRAAVTERGMGLLVLPSGTEPVAEPESFLPWKFLTPIENESDASRVARLSWAGLAAPLEEALPLDRTGFKLQRGERELVRDTQGRPVVAATRRGRGEVAVSLATETWRWQLADQPQAFAAYWSFVLSQISKPHSSDRWLIANDPAAPLFVDQPVELRYSTAAKTVTRGEVTSQAAGDRAALPLAQDPDEPTTWRSTFWPRHAGWHRVSAAGGAQLDFFVHETTQWASLGPARRSQATSVAAALSSTEPRSAHVVAPPSAVSGFAVAGLYALFVLSTGYLWLERRRAAA